MSPVRRLNHLGLDAALIAACWHAVFAAALEAPLRAAPLAVLAASVWLTYQSDRLFDAARHPPDRLLSERHRFAKRHAHALWLAWAVVLAATAATALLLLPQRLLLRGAALLAVCLLYTAANQSTPGRFFPKELFVGGIFAAGVAVFIGAPLPWGGMLAFGLICVLNCLLISARERDTDAAMGAPSLGAALPPTAWPACFAAAAAGLLAAPRVLVPPLAISLALLFVLHRNRDSFSPERFRLLADWSLFAGPVAFAVSRLWLN